ncbi:MAG: hypothetical protein ACK5JH_06870 [Anaerocolumna sp.]
MVIASMGFGNIGGVLTLMFILNCFLIRSFTSSIESLGYEIIEALKATGAPWIILALKGVLTMAFGASISLGVIGVDGVGKILISALAQYKYGQVTLGVVVIFITMYIVEISTVRLKSVIKKGSIRNE